MAMVRFVLADYDEINDMLQLSHRGNGRFDGVIDSGKPGVKDGRGSIQPWIDQYSE